MASKSRTIKNKTTIRYEVSATRAGKRYSAARHGMAVASKCGAVSHRAWVWIMVPASDILSWEAAHGRRKKLKAAGYVHVQVESFVQPPVGEEAGSRHRKRSERVPHPSLFVEKPELSAGGAS